MSKDPLYPRVLRLRHVHPSGWQRLLFWEGSFVVGALLVLADIASAWTLVVLPLAVALVVKGNDLLAGLIQPGRGAVRGGAPAALHTAGLRSAVSRTLRHAAAPYGPPVPELHDLPAGDLDGIPAEAASAFAGLTRQSLQLARAMLEDQHGFLPFACTVSRTGQQATTGPHDAGDTDDRTVALAALHRVLIERREALEAVAVVADAQSADGDAVLVELGHRSGASLLLVAPYRLSAAEDGTTVTFSGLTAMDSASSVFPGVG